MRTPTNAWTLSGSHPRQAQRQAPDRRHLERAAQSTNGDWPAIARAGERRVAYGRGRRIGVVQSPKTKTPGQANRSVGLPRGRATQNEILSVVELNAAAAEFRGRILGVSEAELVVVDDRERGLVPHLEAERVHVRLPLQVHVGRGEEEEVVAAAVDRAGALVLRFHTGDHEPLVGRRLEVEAGRLELELGAPIRR